MAGTFIGFFEKNMKKLFVLADWAYPKEKTWSGTTWSMTQALSRYYDVEIKNLSIGKILKKIDRLSKLKLIGIFFGWLYDILLSTKANQILGRNKHIPVFEICEDVKVKNPYFTYQDMTWLCGQYVKEMQKQHSFIFEAAGNGSYPLAEIKRRIKRQRKEYKFARAIFFMGHWVENIMTAENPDLAKKMHYLGGGTNADYSRVNWSQKKRNKFLFIGRDFERKAGDLVVTAFQIVKEKYMPSAELHIAGPSKNMFEDLENVFFYGDVSNDKVCDLMNKCDVFCMPSRFEAYGLVFVESLIYGMPCVARDFFEMPYFIKNNEEGYLIKDDDPELFAKKMYEAISNTEMIELVKSRKDKYINEYSWDSVAKRAKKEIDKLWD